MPDPNTATRTVTVVNPDGIHARAAMAIAETARRFDCRVTIIKRHERVEGTDVLQILSMATYCGETLQLEAVGPEAEQALAALEELFAHGLNNDDART